ncbi:unnamed protein product [Linum tenue]|uniref:Fucosyltransferase n=1 Tax=Linum tenue TaxID=586396 RepID=A0AAV0KK41_9ROSI|nr:unnamed protein product [Linum tenue]
MNSPLEQSSTVIFSEPSCLSRSQLHLHQKPPPLSPYLLSRLRDYEHRHKRCDPLSEPFQRDSRELDRVKKKNADSASDCRYIVFTPFAGMGNRMLALSSAFLYALLTDRVLLVDFDPSMRGLFCEPFHNSTWLLPQEFTFMDRVKSREFKEVFSLGNLLKNQNQNQNQKLALDLSTEYNDYDKLFYRDETQELVKNVPWLVLKSNQYFLPYLFLLPCFRTELDQLFPDKEIVFHHLARYLFNPSNQAWGRITRFYDAYLARAEQRIGLQIRVLDPENYPPSFILPHILRCIQDESRILPRLQRNEATTSRIGTSKAVFIASLFTEFYSELKDMYWTRPIADGEETASVAVYRASHERNQESYSNSHNMNALVDIYLLSMCDFLVTTQVSTFGYVAFGLAGVSPWFLKDPRDYERNPSEPACHRAVSPEPCFQFHPTDYDPIAALHRGAAGPAPVIMYCEDAIWGFKLANMMSF